METLKLDNLREVLIRQEETIIFALIERAQFKRNDVIYQEGGIQIHDFAKCFSDYLLWETEKVHARVRRYTSSDEHPFHGDLPAPILPPLETPRQIVPNTINFNHKIHQIYKASLIPIICEEGDDRNYGSSATCDVACLQALSKRIHYGKYIAEAKYLDDAAVYNRLRTSQDNAGLLEKLTNRAVENELLLRVAEKAKTYGRDNDNENPSNQFKIDPATIASIYERWIIPLTKEVEVAYLVSRSE